jgi:hypothetical protein
MSAWWKYLQQHDQFSCFAMLEASQWPADFVCAYRPRGGLLVRGRAISIPVKLALPRRLRGGARRCRSHLKDYRHGRCEAVCKLKQRG